jgi:hypothetical protein
MKRLQVESRVSFEIGSFHMTNRFDHTNGTEKTGGNKPDSKKAFATSIAGQNLPETAPSGKPRLLEQRAGGGKSGFQHTTTRFAQRKPYCDSN